MDEANRSAKFRQRNTYHDEQEQTNHQRMVDPEQGYSMFHMVYGCGRMPRC